MKIVVLDGYTLNPGDLNWEALNALGELTVYDRTPSDKIIERIGDAQVVFTNKTPLTAEVFDKTSIKFVGVLATGYNVVDVAYAKTKNIPVANIPTYGTDAVAQFTIALLLEVCHHAGEHSSGVFKGEWQNSIDWCYWHHPLIELSGKTMGIIGFGKIGQSVGKIANAFQMNVVYFDQAEISACDFAKKVSLDELFSNSDVISLHCPLFDSTQGIICKENIAKMKDGVIILNTSRGPLIVEQDLVDALDSGKVAFAAMDVVSAEPITANNPLLKAKNCIMTPHIAWATKEARSRLMNIAVDNLKAFIANSPINIVNK